MWYYVKTLQYPVNLKCNDLAMAKYLITQYGGPDGELSASLRYLNQRYTMPTCKTKGLLNDIGTEEMAHVEIIATMVYQIMENSTVEEIKKAGLAGHYADHGKATFYTDATGNAQDNKMRNACTPFFINKNPYNTNVILFMHNKMFYHTPQVLYVI